MTLLFINLLYLSFLVPLLVLSYSASPKPLCPSNERDALLAIKTGFTINNVSYAFGYCLEAYAKIDSWKNGTDCCEWGGVQCNTTTGHVTDLDLECSFLTGTFRLSNLLSLPDLSLLILSSNNVSIIDDTKNVGSSSSWPRFRVLDLSSCNLGHFPSFLRQQSYIEELNLSNNSLRGAVPEWLLGIGTTSLGVLDLSYNALTGGLDHLPWRNMYQIDIRSNMLRGALPVPSLGTNYFWASDNRFSGGIPSTLCDMNMLALLDLSRNNLTGNIPECFVQLISRTMFILDLRQNQLEGVITSLFDEGCPQLFTLSLSGNHFEGSIPKSLTNCEQLQLLDLSNNRLEGAFPPWLNALPSLEVLVLGSNKLNGSLIWPNTSYSFRKLRILDVSNNALTGGLSGEILMSLKAMIEVNNPESWPYMGVAIYDDSILAMVKGKVRPLDEVLNTLVFIDVSRNMLNGAIPEAIGGLRSLRWLSLAHNNFTGNIPLSLANLPLLESLDLSFNRLDGHIPKELVNLNSLEVFNVSENNLVGAVPTAKQFGTFLDDSYLGNPGLCGELLTKKCREKRPRRSTSTEGSGFESDGLDLWVIVLTGYGCGTFVGFAWGIVIFTKWTPLWVARLILKMRPMF